VLSSHDLTELVKRAAAEAGFDLAGIASVSDFPELQHFPQWLRNGNAGEMRYLEQRNQQGELKRVAVKSGFPWARSVVVCALNYYASPGPCPPLCETPGKSSPGNGRGGTGESTRGWISRYAWPVRDYHDSVMERLRQVERHVHEGAGEPVRTQCYVDTGPLLERVYARYAGVGWVGKNTCIINQQLGSWLFLGVILTSLEVFAGLPVVAEKPHFTAGLPAPDRCGTCTRCLDACPTAAFTAPHQLDASRCISYLTIEKRGDIPEELRALMGRHVFGCDICQDVCPWNRKAPVSALPDFQPQSELIDPALEWLAVMRKSEFREEFRGSAVERARPNGMRRNAVIAMGNSGNERFVPLLRELVLDADETVAKHARWSLERLTKQPAK
jgi:epoxyqueuosine reductase